MFLKNIISFISRFFSRSNYSETPNSSPSKTTRKEAPAIKVESFPEVKASTINYRIALIRGHGGTDPGALGNNTSEVEYLTWVIDKVVTDLNSPNVRGFLGLSSLKAVAMAMEFKPTISIQFHLNSFNKHAHGCEVLVIDGDIKSYELAEKFASEFTKKFGRSLRRRDDKGKKILSHKDRGAASLKASGAGVKFLVEPFFIDNPNDFVPKEEYAKFLVEFIKSI